MNDNRAGGIMLAAASVAGLITMALHPVAHAGQPGLPSGHAMEMLVLLNRAVHGLALAALPVLFLGAMALTWRLAGSGRLALAALVVYGFALVALMAAGAMSGFVASDILSRMVEGDPKFESRHMMLDYTFRINQAFASIYVMGSCAAVLLWSFVMVKTRRLAPGLGIYGLVLSPLIALALLVGHLSLDVHGFGLVVLLQSIWFIVAGTLLLRVNGAEPAPGIVNQQVA